MVIAKNITLYNGWCNRFILCCGLRLNVRNPVVAFSVGWRKQSNQTCRRFPAIQPANMTSAEQTQDEISEPPSVSIINRWNQCNWIATGCYLDADCWKLVMKDDKWTAQNRDLPKSVIKKGGRHRLRTKTTYLPLCLLCVMDIIEGVLG